MARTPSSAAVVVNFAVVLAVDSGAFLTIPSRGVTPESALHRPIRARALENRPKHLFGQLARLGILIGGMVGSQQNAAIGQGVFGAVPEFKLTLASDLFSTQQIIQVGLESDSPQGDNHAQMSQSFQFALQERSAVGQLLGQRLVVRRRAAGSGGYIESGQRKSVVPAGRRCLIREAGFKQHRVHELARSVPRERPSGAIRAVCARSQSENEHAGVGIAKAGNGLAPILMFAVCAALLASNALPVFDKAWTSRAGDDLGVQNLEPVGQRHLVILESGNFVI